MVRLAIWAVALILSAGQLVCATSSTVSPINLPFSGSVAVTDAEGNIYMAGAALPDLQVTRGAAQTQPGGGTCMVSASFIGLVPEPCPDAYVSKVRVSGNTSSVVFATYLGGDTADQATALAVDAAGNIYITGTTGGDFPVTSKAAIRSSPAGGIFAAKLSADGSHILYATYLPGPASASPAIAVDLQGNAYITGQTVSQHAFVAKLNSDGTAIVYYIPLAGAGQEAGTAIAADANGNVYVTGLTTSANFPVSAGALQPRLAGTQNAFVAKLDSDGRTAFSTYLGGSGSDSGRAIQVDSGGHIYVAGAAASLDFPITRSAFQPVPLVPLWGVGPGGFIARLTPDGSALEYSSYVFADYAGVTAMTLNGSSGLYLAGSTSAGFPVTATAPQPCFGGWSDIFVAHLDPQGALADATYFGGTANDTPLGLSTANDGSVLLAAWFNNSSGSKPVLARIRFGEPGASTAPCLSPDVLNAATFFGAFGVNSVAPGEFISLTGFGIGPEQGVAYQPGVNGEAPLEIAGVRVLFDGQPAPLLYVQSRQINAIVPFELTNPASTKVEVEYNGVNIGAADVQVRFANPALFRRHAGFSTQGAVLNEDGSINGPSNPARRGSVIALFGTGFGLTNPPGTTGARNPLAPAKLRLGVRVQIGNAEAEVLYAGTAPTLLSGIDQINVRVPDPLTGPGVTVPVNVEVVNAFSTAQGWGATTVAVK